MFEVEAFATWSETILPCHYFAGHRLPQSIATNIKTIEASARRS
jgi:hypothetical protein